MSQGSEALDQTPLHAAHYADPAQFVTAEVVENIKLARDTWRLRFVAPEIASRIKPGQFVMIRLAGFDDPLLGRALALYDVSPDGQQVDVVYLVHGKMTTALSRRQSGELVEVWGPLGNGFCASDSSTDPVDHLVMVAGGIGQTPFLALGKAALAKQNYGGTGASSIRAQRATLCYGVRSADLLAGEEDFRSAGIDLRISSDDGSIGHHGLVTDLLQEALDESDLKKTLVVCCGPEPMMEAVAKVCHEKVRCLVSLETPMACGVGVCFSCVAKVVQSDGSWDYKRTCVEGPVFDAERIVW